MTIKVEAVLIETNRMVDLAHFYTLGLNLGTAEPAGDGQCGFQLGDVYLGLEQVDFPSPPSGRISFWLEVEDALATYNSLLQLGAMAKMPPEVQGNEIIACVYDPDGNVIGLISPRTEV